MLGQSPRRWPGIGAVLDQRPEWSELCLRRDMVFLSLFRLLLSCKAERQYLLTLQVSRYCLLTFQIRVTVIKQRYHQTRDVHHGGCMLAQRLQGWPNAKPALGQRTVTWAVLGWVLDMILWYGDWGHFYMDNEMNFYMDNAMHFYTDNAMPQWFIWDIQQCLVYHNMMINHDKLYFDIYCF